MKIAICDDDKKACQRTHELIEAYSLPEYYEVDFYSDGKELLKSLHKGDAYDIIFLDIEMEKSNGIDTADEVRKISKDIIIIFVSCHKSYVFDAFRCEALHFLVKPVEEYEFNDVFTRAINKYNNMHCFLPLKWQNQREQVTVSEVMYVESYRRHLIVHTTKEKFEVVGKLSDIFKFLESHGFVRTHQGYIVNMNYIRRFGTDDILLKNGEKVMLSVRKRMDALMTYDKYLQKWCW